MLQLAKKYVKLLGNKYVVAGIALSLFLIFNDRYGLIDQYEYSKNLKEVKDKHAYYTKEIERVKREQNELFGSNKNLEKFAREKYLMKADNEDVFVMIEGELETEE
jgi:cell division protein FtsB